MNTHEITQEIFSENESIATYNHSLRVLGEQASRFGSYIPMFIQVEIDDVNEKIRACQNRIRYLTDVLEALRVEQDAAPSPPAPSSDAVRQEDRRHSNERET